MQTGPAAFAESLFSVLVDAGVRQVAYVPDAGHAGLIELCHASESLITVRLTTEEEGVTLSCGAWLGGHRSVLLMQSSGVGNCVNALGMVRACRFPLLAIITMRGEDGEFNPWQVPMGRATPEVLGAMGVVVRRADEVNAIPGTVAGAAEMAFEESKAVAVLINQRFVGFKAWK